jgi:phosphinothricin acetyltransferase
MVELGDIVVSEICSDDYADVARIFEEAINNGGNSTFETAAPASFDKWINGKVAKCCIIARAAGSSEALGWASLSLTSSRKVFSGVVELSLYITETARNKGLGKRIMNEIIHLSEAEGIWTIQSGIFPENEISITLHEKFGFRRVGFRERVGYMLVGPYAETWRDIVLLERRSKIVGV